MDALRSWAAKRRLPLIVGLAVLVCALTALAVFGLAPERRILRAMERTVSAAKARRDTDLARLGLPLAQAGEAMAEQTWYLGAPPGPLVPDTGVSAESGVGLVLRSDLPGGRFDADASLQAGRVPVYRATVQGREDLLSLRVPSVALGSYGVRTTTLGADWNASVLPEITGIVLDERVGFSPVALARQLLRLQDNTHARLQTLYRDLLGDMEAQNLGHGEYALSINEGAVGAFLKAAATTLREDPAANLGHVAAQIGAEVLPEAAKALLGGGWWAADALEALAPAPLEGRVWLDGGRVRRMTLSIEVGPGEAAFELLFGAGSDPLDGFTLLTRVGDTRAELSLAGGAATREGVLDRSFSASLERGGEVMSLTAGLWVDMGGPAGGSLAIEAAANTPAGGAALWMAGAVNTAGDTMTVVLDDCLLTLGDSAQPFTAEYSVSPLWADIFGEIAPVMVQNLSRDELERLFM